MNLELQNPRKFVTGHVQRTVPFTLREDYRRERRARITFFVDDTEWFQQHDLRAGGYIILAGTTVTVKEVDPNYRFFQVTLPLRSDNALLHKKSGKCRVNVEIPSTQHEFPGAGGRNSTPPQAFSGMVSDLSEPCDTAFTRGIFTDPCGDGHQARPPGFTFSN